jgi:hypothetical protein
MNANEVVGKWRKLQRTYHERDARWDRVREVRRGNIEQVWPDLQSEAWPKSIVANFVDVVARDLAEVIAPLPAFNCSSGTMVSDKARRFADKRTKVAHGYIDMSDLANQMLTGADQYVTYGIATFYIEADFKTSMPRICMEDPSQGYPDWDRFGRLRCYIKVIRKPAWQVVLDYPEARKFLVDENNSISENRTVELLRYCDDTKIMLVLPSGKINAVLASVDHKLGKIPMVVAKRPGLDWEIRGQFDDVIWVQIARDALAKLTLESAEKSVRATAVLPRDVTDISTGPDAVIYTNDPQGPRYISPPVPQTAFAENSSLAQELREGARYPSGRQGDIDATVITGRGVQALMGGFDTQIKSAQIVLRTAFADVVEKCFLMDETYWPGKEKEIRGTDAGAPYVLKYVPSRDIDREYSVDVSYGFAAGLDPNRALVFMLQLRGDKAISRDTMQRNLPFDLNVSEEQSKITAEEAREALLQSLFGLAQSIPGFAMAGQDPSGIVSKFSKLVQDLAKGKSIEDAAVNAFPEPAPTPATPEQPSPGTTAPGAEGGLMQRPFGTTETGLRQGVAPGQAGMAPGGKPDIAVALAGINPSGKPNLSQRVERRTAI